MSDNEIKNGQDERDTLQIVNDPQYRITKDSIAQETNETNGLSRRDLLKYGGATAAALSVVGAAATGFNTAQDGTAYTGFGRQFMGQDQFFNREPFRAEHAAMTEQIEPATRPDWHEYYLRRNKETNKLIASKKWNPTMGVEKMPGYLGEYYRSHPAEYENLLTTIALRNKRFAYYNQGAYQRYALTDAYQTAYSNASTSFLGFTIPEDPQDALRVTGKIQPPEVWDFRHIKKKRPKMEFKSPKHASELIKTVAHRFGASFVGIAPFEERFMFKNVMRGYPDLGVNYGDKVPEHWKSMIVFAVPMEWDKTQAAASFFTAADGYFRVRVVAGLLDRFIQELGYPARPQTPVTTYEVSITPFVLTSGLGEYARAGFAMIPEVGANFRSAGVITNIEFEYDKPININMANFCKKCKICADTCPSGAIETGDEPAGLVRGAKRWKLDYEKCHRGWMSTVSFNCSTCVAVCPFTRKNTWIHTISRELDARDSFGLVGEGLLAMQLNFFKYPKAEEFMGEYAGGLEKTYHNPPKWMTSEEWFSNVDVDWEWDGMH